jgi:hypothetical protein
MQLRTRACQLHTGLFWYRGGREAWETQGLPAADLSLQGW